MSDEKMKNLETAISVIEKSYGKGSIMRLGSKDVLVPVNVIPSGCLSIDAALGVGGFPRGRVIEIYGPESSGKTTLAKLILGFYLPSEGRVFIDGHDIRTLSKRDLRRRIGVVPQDVFLFSGTIRENIAFGDPDVHFERTVAAAQSRG